MPYYIHYADGFRGGGGDGYATAEEVRYQYRPFVMDSKGRLVDPTGSVAQSLLVFPCFAICDDPPIGEQEDTANG